MAHCTGWILDICIEQNHAVIWIKSIEGNVLKLLDAYQPNFYMLPKDEFAGSALFQMLSQEPMVTKVEWVQKFTDLFDPANRGIRRLISVYPKSILAYKTLVKRLEKDARVVQLFDTDLSHLQQYLFKTLKIEQAGKAEVEYDENTFRLISITNIEGDTCTPPPFSILYFDIRHDLDNNQIRQIRARYEGEQDVSFEGEEENILTKFHEYFVNKDPDILIFSRDNYSSMVFYDLITKTDALGFDIGRDPSIHRNNNKASGVNGRVYLNKKSFYNDLDLAGLIERARFGFLPLSLAARYGVNRLIDSRNCYTLIQKGFVVPTSHTRVHEPIRTVEEIHVKDKAGMIFSPSVGLHENVVVLDYENEYANLIIKHNLSPETINVSPNQSVGRKELGLLPTILESVLKRRIYFKNLKKTFPVNTSQWVWCQQCIDSLKGILVSLYGITGSFWNRFANVLVFEEINRLARDVLIKTKDIVQANGFELLYADTDAVFLRKDGAPIEEYEGQGIDKYKSLFPHVSAAILLAKKGMEMNAGEGVEYIFTNTHHNNPLYRVTPKAFIEENGDINYNKEKYRDMLLEAAETVLSIFGFNRTAYGDAPKKYKKWWQRLNEERLKDRDTERT